MIEDPTRLDGNAAAGTLSRFFALDVTEMLITCAACGAESPLGKLHLYGGGMGIVLRCVACGEVNLCAVEVRDTLRLDARGAACLALQSR
jgi:hypothetical protein